MGGRDDEAVVVLSDRQQSVHLLDLLRGHTHGGRDLLVRRVVDEDIAHVGAHRGEATQRQLNGSRVSGREQAGQVLQRDTHLRDGGQQDLVVLAVAAGRGHLVDDRGQRRHVPDHRQGAELGVQRQGDLVLGDELPDRGLLGGRDPRVGNAVGLGLGDHLRVVRVEQDLALGAVQVALVLLGRGPGDAIRVVEQHAQVAQAAHAGFRADGRLADLEAGVAQRALLGLARVVVEVDLLVGAGGDAHAPSAALILVDEDDAVLGALVHRARGARRHAGRVQAVLADARQVEHVRVLNGLGDLEVHLVQDRVLIQGLHGAAQIIVPVRAPLGFIDVLARDCGLRAGRRDRAGVRGCLEQLVVLVRPRLVVVLHGRLRRVREDLRERGDASALTGNEAARGGTLPAALPLLLVLPAAGVAHAGTGFDVVEPDVFGTLAVRPHLLTGDGTGVAADALVEVHHHRDLSHDLHQNCTSWERRRITVTSSRLLPVGP